MGLDFCSGPYIISMRKTICLTNLAALIDYTCWDGLSTGLLLQWMYMAMEGPKAGKPVSRTVKGEADLELRCTR